MVHEVTLVMNVEIESINLECLAIVKLTHS